MSHDYYIVYGPIADDCIERQMRRFEMGDIDKKELMKEDMISALAQILIEEKGYSMEEALRTVYNSDTFKKLQNSGTGFYYKSVGYLFTCLQEELK